MQTKINLLSSGTIDMYDDISVSCTYSIADIKDPDKRNTNFSKTITIPGTKNNNKLFGQLFEIGIDGSFNPNLKTPCNLTVDNVIIMRGNLQLLTVKKIDNDKIEYDCTIIGVTGNIFAELSDNKLEYLDLSEYDHNYYATIQSASWATNIIKNGSYYPFTLGEGYVYPLIDYGDDSQHTTWDVTQLLPAIYAKTYLDKIFEYAGFTYKSNFLTSTFFKSLIIPGTKGTLTDSQIDLKEFKASTTGLNTITNGTYVDVPFNNDTTGGYDPGNCFDTTFYRYYAATGGQYEFETNIQLRVNLGTPPVGAVKYGGSQRFYIRIRKQEWASGLYTDVLLDTITIFYGSLLSIPIGNLTPYYDYISKAKVDLDPNDSVFVEIISHANWVDWFNVSNILISQTYTSYFIYNSNSYFTNRILNNTIHEGEILVINNTIPTDVLMKDYLMSIIRMFNLYVEPDANIENQLNIEPRNTFYSTASPLDWTSKLSLDKPLEIKPMAALDAKTYRFTYKEDDDYYNAIYKAKYGKIFGERIWDVQNDFLKNEKKIELIFAPTPDVNFTNSDRVTPAIYSQDAANIITKKAGKLRILYYGGLLTCNKPWIHKFFEPAQIHQSISYNTYPFCGMVDNPTNPTLYIGFGVPKEVYWIAKGWPTDSLFNNYYKSFIEEISDKDSKLVVAYLYLTISDINQLDFSRLIYIDGINYRLNKIIDFSPVLNQLTKVELLKAKNQTTFIPKRNVVRGGVKNNINNANPL